MVSSSRTGSPLVVHTATEHPASRCVDTPDTSLATTALATDPRLQAALDDLAHSLSKLEHLLPALEGLDDRLREVAQGLQAHAGAAATTHGRVATIVAVQKADASSRQPQPLVESPAGLGLAHGAT